MALRLIRTAIFALAALCASQVASCEGISKAPLTLYAFGGAADIWSTRGLPPFKDRSFAGPIAGPAITTACFATADYVLQSKGRKGWAKVLRIGYVVGITAVVVHNRRYR
jgi:hypothetical protein